MTMTRFGDIDLNRGQPDARGRVHGLEHVVHQPPDAVVHARPRAVPCCAGAGRENEEFLESP